MRWPNRHPHVLTPGMRHAQRALAGFLPLIDWTSFRRRNLSDVLRCDDAGVAVVGCGDAAQALVWLVRTDALGPDGTLAGRETAAPATLTVPGLADGGYTVTVFDTLSGTIIARAEATSSGGVMLAPIGPVRRDAAVAIRGHARG